ncbi:hypothetical protein F2P81_017627 [Scophthalmus maximus]|uniref:Uncharacterized protein n=1 Tax=Scophthalmus maximus TaxID=52904 RepID=A0A6A4S6P6_SCOMX|nr:hypothetical protein F2P81_017627 [Scophthalmus maximus]
MWNMNASESFVTSESSGPYRRSLSWWSRFILYEDLIGRTDTSPIARYPPPCFVQQSSQVRGHTHLYPVLVFSPGHIITLILSALLSDICSLLCTMERCKLVHYGQEQRASAHWDQQYSAIAVVLLVVIN